MAVVKFVNYQRGQTRHGMGAVIRYTVQDKKTLWEDRQLVTGVNCQPQTVYGDFMTTKNLYHKTDGVMFFHMVQSFPKGEEVDAATAHAAALELAQYYKCHEVLVCTHTDRDHIHSHFIINSVNFDTGRKLHIATEQLQELRQLNDQVCLKYDLPVFQAQPRQRKAKSMTTAEYHMAKNGQSKKMRLMNVIADCMRYASTREEFIALMESEGYQVRWEKNRKSITYTAPDGWKCRDNKLFEDRFLKEKMEYEFRIREDLIYGGTDGAEPSRAYEPADAAEHPDLSAADSTGSTGHDTAGDSSGTDTGADQHTHGAGLAGDDVFPAGAVSGRADADRPAGAATEEADHLRHKGADGRDGPSGAGTAESGGTGWEAEREAFFAFKTQSAQTGTAQTGGARPVPAAVGAGNSASALVRLGRTVEDNADGTDDPEEKRRRIQAKIEAENFGAALGLTIGVASVIADRLSERHLTADQPEEPTDTDEPDEPISAEAPEQEPAEQLTPEEPEENPAVQLTPEELEALEILEQEECNEYQAQSDLWQMTM